MTHGQWHVTVRYVSADWLELVTLQHIVLSDICTSSDEMVMVTFAEIGGNEMDFYGGHGCNFYRHAALLRWWLELPVDFGSTAIRPRYDHLTTDIMTIDQAVALEHQQVNSK